MIRSITYIILALGFQSSTAIALDTFKLKGIQLQTSTNACGTEEISNHQNIVDDLGIGEVQHPASSCEIKLDSFAGIIPSEKANLLFWEGKLTSMTIKFEALSLEQVANLRTALLQSFGKSKFKRDKPFNIDTWSNKDGQIKLEVMWFDFYNAKANIQMTDSATISKYWNNVELINKLVKKSSEKKRSKDIM